MVQSFDAAAAKICHAPAHVYHGWPEVNATQLKALASSPVEYYERFIAGAAPAKTSDALAYGTLLHLWAELGDKKFWQVAVRPEKKYLTAGGLLSKSASEWQKSLGPEAVILTPSDEDKLRRQTAQILANTAARQLLYDSIDAEFNVRFTNEGHACRCRCDGATDYCWYDLKTTREKYPLDGFWKAVKEYRYDIQAAHYLCGAMQVGWDRHAMHFIVTSTVYPYHCEVMTLPDKLLEKAERQVASLLEELATRTEWESWLPDTYGQVHEMPCPAFMLKEEGEW